MDQEFTSFVSELRRKTGLIGLGAMLMQDGEIAASAVDGKRKKGSRISLTESDQWHIGSITKSFTSALISRLVENSCLSWDTTVSDVFFEADIHDAWRSVTLAQLLTHTSGAPPDFNIRIRLQKPSKGLERIGMARLSRTFF